MQTINKPTLILGTLLLGVPFILDTSLLVKLLIAFVGGQLFYYGLEAHKDMFYVLYRKNLGKAKELGISREKLYSKCLDTFEEIPTLDKYLFAYSVSPSRIKNCSWIAFLTIGIASMTAPLPEVPVQDYKISRQVGEILPVPIGCKNQKAINVAVNIGKEIFKVDSVDYEVMYGADCSCGYCKKSNLYYGESIENLSTLYIYTDSLDIIVVLDKDTGLIERIQQTVVSIEGVEDKILYERNSDKEGINKSLDNISIHPQ